MPSRLQASSLLPLWVRRMFAGDAAPEQRRAHGLTLETLGVETYEGSQWVLAAVTLPGAAQLDDAALRATTRSLYGLLCEAVMRDAWKPVRLWNFIPQINRPTSDGLDRYMVFNAGRFEALRPRFATLTTLPTATGVGHQGDDLHVFCLASDRSARAIENPRQCSAYRYSKRFGPHPPCFSRATLVEMIDQDCLLIGGTAAIRGERSIHTTSLRGQLEETFINLEALVERASDGETTFAKTVHELRVFVRRPDDMAQVEQEIRARLPNLRHLETMVAAICRDELLVEIEGVASFPAERRVQTRSAS